MGKTVFINGRYVDGRSAKVSVFDRGFNYGDGLFETVKAYDGRPFLFKEHIQRLKRGARSLRIPITALKDIEKKSLRLLDKNGLTKGEAYLKVVLTRGVDTRSMLPSKAPSPTLVITAGRLKAADITPLRVKGVKAVLLDGPAPAQGGGLSSLKTLNFLPYIAGRMHASRRGAYEGIFTDPDGRLLEGTATNLFLVRKDAIMTPPLNGIVGILPGITRGFIIKLAKRAGMRVLETPLYVKDLKTSDEAFLTNSIVELLPLVRVEGGGIGHGRPGPVTRLLQEKYREAVRRT